MTPTLITLLFRETLNVCALQSPASIYPTAADQKGGLLLGKEE